MANWNIIIVGVLCAVLLLTVSISGQSQCPPENPFCPVWVPCNYTEVQGPYCQDCNTRVICTAIGGLVRPCWVPGSKYCVDGECASQPSQECLEPTSTTEDVTHTMP